MPNWKKVITSGSNAALNEVTASALAGIVESAGALTNYILKFDGTKFVAVDENTSFVFGIDSFTANTGDTLQLIGSGVWKAASSITYTATYNAGPPTSANIGILYNGTMTTFAMSDPFTSATNPSAINYPSNVNHFIAFRLAATKSLEEVSADSSTVTFRNFRAYGSLTNNTSLGSTDIDTLYSANNNLTNSSVITLTNFTVDAGKYFGFAYRDALSDPAMVRCGTGVNELTVAMDPSDATNKTPATTQVASYTNANGFQENYRIIASKETDITDHDTRVTITTSAQVYNYLYFSSASADPATGTDVTNLAFSESKNSSVDEFTFNVGPLDGNNFVYIAVPSRYGDANASPADYSFVDVNEGFPFAINSTTTVIAVTNPVGFTENYNVYKSANQLDTSGADQQIKLT